MHGQKNVKNMRADFNFLQSERKYPLNHQKSPNERN